MSAGEESAAADGIAKMPHYKAALLVQAMIGFSEHAARQYKGSIEPVAQHSFGPIQRSAADLVIHLVPASPFIIDIILHMSNII